MNRREELAAKLHADTNANGGATYHFGGAVPLIHKDGFMVGGAAGLSVILPVEAKPEAYAKAIKALEAVADAPIAFIGTWIDGQHVYVDACNHYRYATDALLIAGRRGELAIWDVEACQSIYLHQ